MRNFMLAALALCLLSATAFAQGGGGGSLTGSVAGPDGNIAGATVTAKDNQTGKEQTVQASGEGAFTFAQLEVGTYTVTVTAPGFKTRVYTDVKIDAGRPYNLPATLEVGNISETVEVVAGADVVNSTNAELSNTVTPRQVKELPINGRNPLNLLNLIAGSNTTSSSINGQRSSSVNYTRDGMNVQDNFIRNGFVSDQPTVDDTGEFTVITQNAGAEYGTGSTQVVLVTPRGGSDFHGNAFIFNRNSRFAANNFFNNLNNVPRAFLNRNQFGGTLSGPAIFPHFGEGGPRLDHGKSFFFANYEGFRLANQVPITTTTLLGAARTGNFTYTVTCGTPTTAACPAGITSGQTLTANVLSGAGLSLATSANQATFTSAGGVLGVDPAIQSRFLNPLPTSGNGAFTGINYLQAYSFQRQNPENRDAVTGRYDIDFNDKNSANFVFKRNTITDARTDIAAGVAPTTFVSQGGPTTLVVLAYRMSPTTSLTNEIRGGYQRAEPFFNATTDPRNLPFLVSGLPVTNAEASFQSQGRNTDYWNLQDNATWTRGNHAFRFGGVGQFYRIEAINFAAVTPTYALGTTANTATPGLLAGLFPGGINTTDLARANSLRYFLGGVLGNGSQAANASNSTSGFIAGAPTVRRLNFDNFGFYVSDQWRVSDKLTLNLGLRYELYTPLNNPDQLYLEPVIAAGQTPLQALLNPNGQFQPIGGNAGHAGNFTKMDKNNWGPNVSLAYTPNFRNRFLNGLMPGEGKTVLRGGYRVNYVNDEYVRSTDNAGLNNSGLGSTTALATTSTGATQFRVVGLTNAPTTAPIVVPASAFGPGGSRTRTYAFNNAEAGAGNGFLGGTVSLIDPNLQVQRNYEYNVGIQREVGFQSVVEIRYVGGYSKQLVRSIDYNQLDIRNNGFLPDFIRAQSNLTLVEATRAQIIAANPNATTAQLNALLAPYPVSGAFNANVTGSQLLPAISKLDLGGLLNNATILTQLRNGVPGALAEIYYANGFTGLNFTANPNAGVANLTTNGGRYNYNSLQAEFRRRFTQGLSFQANYTFQKILTNVTGSTDEVNQTRVEPFLDNANPGRDYGRAIYDRTHTVNINGLYELPFGRGKRWLNEGGAVDKIFGGFQFSSIVNLSSGVPTTIIDARGTLNRAGRSGTQPATTSLSADDVKKLFGVFKTPNGVFIVNPSVLFAVASGPGLPTLNGVDLTKPLPAGYTITSVRGANPVGTAPFAGQVFFPNAPGSTGNMTRNFINGPMYFNWDAGLLKNINITENTRLQLRGEVFNVLNNANFFAGSNPGILDVGSTSFGRLTSSGQAYSPRIVQFGARFEF
ncbi:MAG: TonB-dependent receptor [Acidobacteria bacterium]|nr:TonB-dependent receptor [Acidobacteriota bacterium]